MREGGTGDVGKGVKGGRGKLRGTLSGNPIFFLIVGLPRKAIPNPCPVRSPFKRSEVRPAVGSPSLHPCFQGGGNCRLNIRMRVLAYICQACSRAVLRATLSPGSLSTLRRLIQ